MAALVTSNPPAARASNSDQTNWVQTVRYVITAEKTTRLPNLNFVSLMYPEIFEYGGECDTILEALLSKTAKLAHKQIPQAFGRQFAEMIFSWRGAGLSFDVLNRMKNP